MAVKAVTFQDLPGWESDNHALALKVFIKSCHKVRGNDYSQSSDWKEICELAKLAADARSFFEIFFQPILIEEAQKTLFTGYYEPELVGSRYKVGKFKYPLYKRPPELKEGQPWKTRKEIEDGALAGRDLELAWLSDPVESFFLHVQGSGRLKLNEGGHLRVGFAGKNQQPYRSVGKEMIRQGLISKDKASAQGIKAWVRAHPTKGRELLHHNTSFVFFRELTGLSSNDGPPGAIQIPVTSGRTIAVDPKYSPLGAPVWINKIGDDPLHRLMVAQDVGTAIKGAQRADIFFGSGAEAGRIAGRTKATGRMYTLLPHASVFRLIPEG